MNKNEKVINEEILEKISGGVLYKDVIESIDTAVQAYKMFGSTLAQAKKMITESYKDDPYTYSTDGSDEDLQDLLKRFEKAWNKK